MRNSQVDIYELKPRIWTDKMLYSVDHLMMRSVVDNKYHKLAEKIRRLKEQQGGKPLILDYTIEY